MTQYEDKHNNRKGHIKKNNKKKKKKTTGKDITHTKMIELET